MDKSLVSAVRTSGGASAGLSSTGGNGNVGESVRKNYQVVEFHRLWKFESTQLFQVIDDRIRPTPQQALFYLSDLATISNGFCRFNPVSRNGRNCCLKVYAVKFPSRSLITFSVNCEFLDNCFFLLFKASGSSCLKPSFCPSPPSSFSSSRMESDSKISFSRKRRTCRRRRWWGGRLILCTVFALLYGCPWGLLLLYVQIVHAALKCLFSQDW